jgi:hypothetical protein
VLEWLQMQVGKEITFLARIYSKGRGSECGLEWGARGQADQKRGENEPDRGVAIVLH